jgi:hypothetical protein
MVDICRVRPAITWGFLVLSGFLHHDGAQLPGNAPESNRFPDESQNL